jgi:glucose/arabinose dehydrogenase
MRRTVLSAMALACTAVLASTVPAFADGATPTPSPTRPSTSAPSVKPTATQRPTSAPSAKPAPTQASKPGGVSVVPKGAPDTGLAPVASHSGADAGLIGGGTAAVLVAGGAAVFLVRRRRATGA